MAIYYTLAASLLTHSHQGSARFTTFWGYIPKNRPQIIEFCYLNELSRQVVTPISSFTIPTSHLHHNHHLRTVKHQQCTNAKKTGRGSSKKWSSLWFVARSGLLRECLHTVVSCYELKSTGFFWHQKWFMSWIVVAFLFVSHKFLRMHDLSKVKQ